LIVLLGGPSTTRFDSDHEPVFRQESYFWWLTGVKEPDCAVIIQSDGTTKLLIPELPHDYATIMGHIRSTTEWKKMYQVDDVRYTHELEEILANMLDDKTKILLMDGPNSDSGKNYDLAPLFKSEELRERQDISILFPVLAECRVHKSQTELALLEHVTQITSFAHAYVMRNTKPGMMEYQAESLFLHYA
jgi:Xaa-Pro dipeptidase